MTRPMVRLASSSPDYLAIMYDADRPEFKNSNLLPEKRGKDNMSKCCSGRLGRYTERMDSAVKMG